MQQGRQAECVNMSATKKPDLAYRRVVALTAALSLSYLGVSMSLSTVPVYVVHGLGLDNAFGGLAVGIAFLSTILTRPHAGARADQLGGKNSMQRGLIVYAVAGLVCLLASWSRLTVWGGYVVLIAGRLLLGLGESLTMVGAIQWGLGMMGPERSGRVMALVGMGLYGSLAVGAPLGLALLHLLGFAGLMAVCTVLPLLGLIVIRRFPAVTPPTGQRESIWNILGRIWRAGAVLGMAGIGFASLGSFFALYFLSRGWPHAGLGLAFFGIGFILARLLGGHLPDQLGATPIAIASLIVEASGQYLLWLAPGPWTALAGAFLTGLGCSLVYPAMGSEVVKQVPAHLRGTAMGGFVAFQDLSYGVTGPLVGLLADYSGYSVVFLIGALAATLGLAMAFRAHQLARIATA
jgi:MFS family permease